MIYNKIHDNDDTECNKIMITLKTQSINITVFSPTLLFIVLMEMFCHLCNSSISHSSINYTDRYHRLPLLIVR